MLNNTVVAAYLRISQDDASDESNSIRNQRALVRGFIAKQGDLQSAVIAEYIDDGESGETTGRDDYQRLMKDVEIGKIGVICCKDLSP